MKHALIDRDGNVVNVIEWDGVSPYRSEYGVLRADAYARPGGTFDGADFIPPPEPENKPRRKSEVRLLQEKVDKLEAALARAGIAVDA